MKSFQGMDYKISIILPTYNVEKFIDDSVKSLKNQTFNNWELIVVDDGSVDRSHEITYEYAKKDNRIRVVHKENGGLSSARNFGLKYAQGEYVTFFDPDDYAHPFYLKSLLEGENENNPDVIIGGYEVQYEDSEGNVVRKEVRDCPKNGKFTGQWGLDASRFVNYAWNKLFRREFLLQNNLTYEEGLYRIEDAEFMSRFIDFKPKVSFVPQCGYVYVQRPVNTLSNVFDGSIITHSIRRIGIDVKILSFFNNLTSIQQVDLERYLRQSSASALLSRISRQTNICKAEKQKLYEVIRDSLLPSRLSNEKKDLKNYIKYLALVALSHNHYTIVDLIYR